VLDPEIIICSVTYRQNGHKELISICRHYIVYTIISFV